MRRIIVCEPPQLVGDVEDAVNSMLPRLTKAAFAAVFLSMLRNLEKATAIEFAIYTVEIRLAFEIRKANRVVHREWMTGMYDDHHLLAEQRHDVETFVRVLTWKAIDRDLEVASQEAGVELPCTCIGQFEFYPRVARMERAKQFDELVWRN